MSFPTTSILEWFRLPWQAADGRPIHPIRPPPLPDPTCQHFSLLLGSMGLFAVMPPDAGPFWLHLGLLACLAMAWSLVGLSQHPFPRALDRFSNSKGHPSWFIRPGWRPHSHAPPLLHECYHWHPDWSINDTLFWFLMVLLLFGCFLSWLVVFYGISFLLHAGNAWFWWCTGSPCGGSLVNPCGLLLHWSVVSFHQSRSLLGRSRGFLCTDIPAALREAWAADSLSFLTADLDSLFGGPSESQLANPWSFSPDSETLSHLSLSAFALSDPPWIKAVCQDTLPSVGFFRRHFSWFNPIASRGASF
jgi:hypothetical protein